MCVCVCVCVCDFYPCVRVCQCVQVCEFAFGSFLGVLGTRTPAVWLVAFSELEEFHTLLCPLVKFGCSWNQMTLSHVLFFIVEELYQGETKHDLE